MVEVGTVCLTLERFGIPCLSFSVAHCSFDVLVTSQDYMSLIWQVQTSGVIKGGDTHGDKALGAKMA